MSKRGYGMDEAKIQAYMKEGRGQGEGKEYKPWTDIHNFPSRSRVWRYFG